MSSKQSGGEKEQWKGVLKRKEEAIGNGMKEKENDLVREPWVEEPSTEPAEGFFT